MHDEPTLVEDAPAAPSEQPASDRGHPYPGGMRTLAERYELLEPIASGGSAVVWEAYDSVLGRTVAIKLLHPHLAGDPGTVERFRQESVTAAQLSHPNVVSIYDTGQDNDVVYLVMELVDGPTLRDVLAEQGALSAQGAAALGEQVAAALGAAHVLGLVHRDVKPANILLGPDGTAKVTDFGIARALDVGGSEGASPTPRMGTAAYVSPEQFHQTGGVDPRTDVYSLGLVLYEALTGRRAFQGETPEATAEARLRHDVGPPGQAGAASSEVLDEIVLRATRVDPAGRFEDGTALARALHPLTAPGGAGRVRDRDGSDTVGAPEQA